MLRVGRAMTTQISWIDQANWENKYWCRNQIQYKIFTRQSRCGESRIAIVCPNISLRNENLYSVNCLRHKKKAKICASSMNVESSDQEAARWRWWLMRCCPQCRSAWEWRLLFCIPLPRMISWLLTRLYLSAWWKKRSVRISSGLIIMFTWINLESIRYWQHKLYATIAPTWRSPKRLSDTERRSSTS